jgi:hypothetical protein
MGCTLAAQRGGHPSTDLVAKDVEAHESGVRNVGEASGMLPVREDDIHAEVPTSAMDTDSSQFADINST